METTTDRRTGISIDSDRLLEARLNTGLSQEELAALIRSSRRAYQDWEAGRHCPQPRFIRALADELHVSVPWLRGLN